MNDQQNDRIFEIHPFNLGVLTDKLATMQKRARKLKTDPITIEKLGIKMVMVTKTMPGGNLIKFEEERILLKIHGETPKLAGWSLVAKIEFLEEERLISCVPGETCPEEYRTGPFDCDHCHTNRMRKETFILRHTNGDHKQVGRQCIKDFLGGKSPEQMLAEAEYIFRAGGEADDCERMAGGYVPETINITEYLCGVAICIRRLGWLSRGAANVDQASTSSHAWDLVKPVIHTDTDRYQYEQWVEKNRLHCWDRDLLQAGDALEWAKKLPVEGVADYLYNLGVACRLGYVTHKTQGLVASVITTHLRHLEREEEIKQREDTKKSREWVGEIKKRQIFERLTITKMRYIETEWGTTTLVCFESEPGDLIKWFASNDLDDLEEGMVVDIKATPKKFDEYQDVKQTIVNRAVILKKHAVVAV